MNFALVCPQCGDNRFTFPERDGDEEQVACRDCGTTLGTIEELKAKIEQMLDERNRPSR